jgi:hypothetical protein
MKWMWSIAIVVAAVSSAAAVQSGKEMGMGKSAMGDTMTTKYTGCVEAVNHGGSFLLTHIGDDHMGSMHDDGMGKKGAVALVGKPDLKKHVGQKVSVTGSLSKESMNSARTDVETLTVSALKVVAKSCS